MFATRLGYLRVVAMFLAIHAAGGPVSVRARETEQPPQSVEECVATRCAAILSSLQSTCNADPPEVEACEFVRKELSTCQESCENR